MAAEKLDNKFSSMLADLQHLQSEANECYKTERRVEEKRLHAFAIRAVVKHCVLEACIVVHAYICCLEKVCERVHLKELCLVKQGLCELEAKETKMDFTPMEEQTAHMLM